MKRQFLISLFVFSLLKASGYDFLNMPFSSKEAILLEPYGILANSPSAIFINPSAIHNLYGKNMETGYGKYILDMHQGFIIFSNTPVLKALLPERPEEEIPEFEKIPEEVPEEEMPEPEEESVPEDIEEEENNIENSHGNPNNNYKPKGLKLGAGIFFLNAGTFTATDTLGNITGSYKAQLIAVNITSALPFLKEWNSALSLELLYQGIDVYQSFAAAFSFGFGETYENFFRGGRGSIYLFLKHLGYEFKPFDEERASLPYSLVLAGGIDWGVSFLGLSTGYISDETFFLSASYYYQFNRFLGFALGYTPKYRDLDVEDNIRSFITGASFGTNLKIKKISLFYGYSPFGILGDIHRIDLGFSF